MRWQDLERVNEGPPRIAVLGEGHEVPMLLRALTAGARESAAVEAVECARDEFVACTDHLASCGFTGAAVANPFKADAAALAKEFFVVRHGLGVANALKFGGGIYAQNTEVQAFAVAIRGLNPGRALVMGSGRAARSAVLSLFENGWRVKVWNRNVIRSRPFAMIYETYGKVEIASRADPAGCSLIVNATPLGVKPGEQPPVVWDSASPRTTAIDFVFRGVATEFLRQAAKRGFRTVDGRELLVEQAAIALEWWLGKPVPRERMFEAIGFHPLP